MSIAKITLFGLYNYDKTIFDDAIFPDYSLFDKETLIQNILVECGEFESLYSDPALLKMAITNWSKKWFFTFDKWMEALSIKYDPLENYNRVEHWEDNNRRKVDSTTTANRNSTSDTSFDGINDIRRNSFDNTSSLPITDRSETDNTTNLKTNESGKSIIDASDNANNIRDGYARGNIGVTTSQQMLQSSLDLYADFNLYEQMTNIFKTELIIGVYEQKGG